MIDIYKLIRGNSYFHFQPTPAIPTAKVIVYAVSCHLLSGRYFHMKIIENRSQHFTLPISDGL